MRTLGQPRPARRTGRIRAGAFYARWLHGLPARHDGPARRRGRALPPAYGNGRRAPTARRTVSRANRPSVRASGGAGRGGPGAPGGSGESGGALRAAAPARRRARVGRAVCRSRLELLLTGLSRTRYLLRRGRTCRPVTPDRAPARRILQRVLAIAVAATRARLGPVQASDERAAH